MCAYIGVECLAANALIELYEQGIHELSVEQLADFGLMVIESYESQNSEGAMLIFDQNEIWGLVVNYADLFAVTDKEDGKRYISLQEGVDIQKVKERFRWTLSYAMLKALNEVDIMRAINIA